MLKSDGRVGLVASSKLGRPPKTPELFDRKVPVHFGNHDVAMLGLQGAIAHQNIAVENPKVHHGMTAGPPHKCGMGMGNQKVVQIVPLHRKISCG